MKSEAALFLLALERDYYIDSGNYCKAFYLHQIIVNNIAEEIMLAFFETDINFTERSLN